MCCALPHLYQVLIYRSYLASGDYELPCGNPHEQTSDVLGFHQVKLDPMMFFSFLFGSDRFEPWIGELYVDLMIKVMARGATFSQFQSAQI